LNTTSPFAIFRLSWTETSGTIPDTSVDNPTMSAIFCGHDGAPGYENIRRQRAEALATQIAGLSISARKLSPVADVYIPLAGAAQVMGFIIKTAGAALLDGGAVEFPTASTSAFSQVSRRS
jgi:hypothetical protein